MNQHHRQHRRKLAPLFVKAREIDGRALGFLELTTDEQLAKKTFEATGDLVFKGFLPKTWNTARVVQMRNAYDQIKKTGKTPTALAMAMKYPSISQRAHQYYIDNVDKIKGFIPDNFTPGDIMKGIKPLFLVAGLAAVAVIAMQIVPLLPKKKAEA